jgi:hypothetical protein
LLGGLVGILLYDRMIAPFLPPEDKPAPPGTIAP